MDLIHEFIASLREDRSLVKQMIMGAGKTTVVSPLLALMLADGRNLVMRLGRPSERARVPTRAVFNPGDSCN